MSTTPARHRDRYSAATPHLSTIAPECCPRSTGNHVHVVVETLSFIRRNTQSSTATYQLKEKCANDAREYFQRDWSANDSRFVNHYSKKEGKCYLMITVNQPVSMKGEAGHFIKSNYLFDVLENRKVGEMTEWNNGTTPSQYEMNGRRCSSPDGHPKSPTCGHFKFLHLTS